MPASAPPPSPVFALLGAFDAGPLPALLAALSRAGLAVALPDAPSVTHCVRGARSARLSSLLGSPPAPHTLSLAPARTHWTEADLDAHIRALLGVSLADLLLLPSSTLPPSPAPHERPAPVSPAPDAPPLARAITAALASRDTPLARLDELARALASEHAAHPALDEARAALLRDPRTTDAPAREALCRALAARATPFALHALAEALTHAPPSRDQSEARAFASLAARGVTRFATPTTPFALTYETPPAPSSLDAFALRVGPVERLTHGSPAAHTTRVRIATLPDAPALPALDTLVALFAEASTRPRAQVYLAGCTLPASLPRATWIALLSPLGAP